MLKQKRRGPEPESRAASRELVPWAGEQVDVDRFWAESWIDLLNRQRWLSKKLKLETAPWQVDQKAGVIQFERKDGALVSSAHGIHARTCSAGAGITRWWSSVCALTPNARAGSATSTGSKN